MGSLGSSELIIILVVLLVLFGGAKLPQLARSLGQAQRELKAGKRDDPEPTTSESGTESKDA